MMTFVAELLRGGRVIVVGDGCDILYACIALCVAVYQQPGALCAARR